MSSLRCLGLAAAIAGCTLSPSPCQVEAEPLEVPEARNVAASSAAVDTVQLTDTTPLPAVSDEGKFHFHGFLTQAYARSSRYQYLGINSEGTTDYRNLALQFRYDLTPDDQFVVQLQHRRIGASKALAFQPDVSLNWAFYEHRFGASTTVKAGRLPRPFGIYNEIRNVGTLLPFYRVPYTFYWEGDFRSETVDGALASQQIDLGRGWSLSVDGYYGGYHLTDADYFQGTTRFGNSTVKDAIGSQVWLRAPIAGARIGASVEHRGDWEGTITFGPSPKTFLDVVISLEAVVGPVTVRAERVEGHVSQKSTGERVSNGIFSYGEVIVGLTKRLSLAGRYDESTRVDFFAPGERLVSSRGDLHGDLGLALAYRANAHTVLKLEGHRLSAVNTLEEPSLNPLTADPLRMHYWIASVAVGF